MLKHQKIFSLFIYFIYNYVFNFNSQLGLGDFDINTLYVHVAQAICINCSCNYYMIMIMYPTNRTQTGEKSIPMIAYGVQHSVIMADFLIPETIIVIIYSSYF